MRDHDKVSKGFGFVLSEDSASINRIMAAKKDGAEFIINEQNVVIKRALANGGNVGASRSGGLYLAQSKSKNFSSILNHMVVSMKWRCSVKKILVVCVDLRL